MNLAWGNELVQVKGEDWDEITKTSQLFGSKHHRILAKLVGRIRTHWRDRSANHNTSNAEDFGYAMVIQLLKEELVEMLETDCHEMKSMQSGMEDDYPDDWEEEIEPRSSEAFDREWFEAQVSMAEAQADR